MPATLSYTCEVCHAAVDDSDLETDTTGALRRIIVAGGSTTRPSAGSVEERQYPQLIFCGYAHAGDWLASQSF